MNSAKKEGDKMAGGGDGDGGRDSGPDKGPRTSQDMDKLSQASAPEDEDFGDFNLADAKKSD